MSACSQSTSTSVRVRDAMIVMREEDGFTILHGEKRDDWIVAPWWPCSAFALRTVARSKASKAFVDEAAAFAEAELWRDRNGAR